MSIEKSKIKEVISNLSDSKILLVVPPFALVDLPCIGLDILQSIANSCGLRTSVLYANLLFAELIGVEKYKTISSLLMSMHTMLGERIFTNAAYKNMPLLGKSFEDRFDENFTEKYHEMFSDIEMRKIAQLALDWTEMLAEEISNKDYDIVGVTTGHQQTNAAIALINAIKAYDVNTICVMGGSACDGEMAEGIVTLSSNIDYVFSGESELSWRAFLENYQNGCLPKERILRSDFPANLDEIIVNEDTYKDYYAQSKNLNMDGNISLLYESSRGCWWGERNKCTFCGVNGWNKHYRYKSEEKVVSDLSQLIKNNPHVTHIQMVDTLMPRHYFKKLIPSLKEKLPNIDLFYEQRADLTFAQVLELKLCGLNYTQVGIESLSSGLLDLLNKGVKATQNIRFLRYCRSVGLLIGWNLLTEIPNDKKEYWTQVIKIIPLIHHLNPPMLIRPVEIARFSPYFENPQKYGIAEIKPAPVYLDIFPETANIQKLAWLFDTQFVSDSKDDLMLNKEIKTVVTSWMNKWKDKSMEIPVLNIKKDGESYVLEDSRFGHMICEIIDRSKAKVALFGVEKHVSLEDVEWGINRKVLCLIDGGYVPLATAHPRIFKELQNERINA